MNSTSENSLISLLVNDDFINYVVNPTLVLDEMWADFFTKHPEMKLIADEAKSILLGECITDELPASETLELQHRIFEQCGLSVA